jgi:VIT1/CCC1 family predicted Fe2+/Mn2+ transporter
MQNYFNIMNNSFKAGLGFGIASAVITTLGLMVGLLESTNSKLAVIAGVITIAIVDALSDAMGIHLSQEYSNNETKNVWIATATTFISKLVFGLIFLIPILLFELKTAVKINIIWGFLVIVVFSYIIAKTQKEKIWKVIFEHITIFVFVLFLTYYLGKLIAIIFK